MSPLIEAAIAKWGMVFAGVFCGFAAKYGLLMKKGDPITIKMIVADILLLGVVALIAFNFIDKIGLANESAALVTALITVGADRGVRRLTDHFWSRVDVALGADIQRRRGELRQEAQIEISADRVLEDRATGKRELGE